MEKFKAWDEKTESTKHSCFRHRGDRENGHQWWHLPERYQRWHLNGRHHWRRRPSERHHWREGLARPYTSNCFSMSRVGIYSYHRQQLDHRQLQYHRQHWHHWQLSDHRHISHNRHNLDVAFDNKKTQKNYLTGNHQITVTLSSKIYFFYVFSITVNAQSWDYLNNAMSTDLCKDNAMIPMQHK